MPSPVQECSRLGCTAAAAFKTRTRPAWCDAHITAILSEGGLEPLEPFVSPKAYRLTRCTTCGCEAHYRFEYVLDQNAINQPTCRACHWRAWAAGVRAQQATWRAPSPPVPDAVARQHATACGYQYLEALTSPSLQDDPHRVQCLACGRITAERLGDIGFGCPCRRNPKREARTGASDSMPAKKKDLLKDSDLPAVEWWAHDLNDPALWDTLTTKARREPTWRCPDCALTFTEKVYVMAGRPQCPDCEAKRLAARQAQNERYRHTPVTSIPELRFAWADRADPKTVMVGDWTLRRFRCPQGHHPRITPQTYLEHGCPSCRGNATREKRIQAATLDPTAHSLNSEIASQFHPTLNGNIRMETLPADSKRTIWWIDAECGHTWQQTPRAREKGQRLRCPKCRSILDSLAYHHPEIATEWAPTNPLTAWQVRPTATTLFTPTWVCATNPAHTWEAPIASRVNGAGCPECREAGKSKVELDHHAAAETIFGIAASGRPIASERFRHRSRWIVDITTALPDGTPVAIEYDGAYWHADKIDIDTPNPSTSSLPDTP